MLFSVLLLMELGRAALVRCASKLLRLLQVEEEDLELQPTQPIQEDL